MSQFDSRTPEKIQTRKAMQTLCRQFQRSPSHGNLKRLKEAFRRCGDDVFIESGFYCDYGHYISLGSRVFINANCTFLDAGEIVIGDDCLIGPNVQILAVSHDADPSLRLAKHSYAIDTRIGENVWIGAGAIILPGVSVGAHSIVGAGAVVSRDVAKNTRVAGNPAKEIE